MKSSTQPTKAEQQRFDESVERTEQQAFDRSYKRARREIAKADGAAAGAAAAGVDAGNGLDGAGSSAIERARQRALGIQQPAKTGLQNPSSVAKPLSGRLVESLNYGKVPEEFYDWQPEQQQRFLKLVAEKKEEEEGGSRFDRTALAVLDQNEAMAKRITALESQLVTAVGVIETMRGEMQSIDTTVEVAKSEALAGQQGEIAQMATNLLTIKLQAGAEMDQYKREMEAQKADHRARLEASERVLNDHENRLKSNAFMMGERANAVTSKLASMEGQQSRLAVQIEELEGRTDAIGNPITRPEMQALVSDAVSAEFPAQLPAMVSKELAVQKATGELGEGVEIDRAYLAQTVENSDERSKRFEITQQQIDESKFTNPTERAIKRALKKGGKG